MKTSDLTGSLLDQWVARALGLDTLPLEPGNWCWVYVKNGTAKEAFRPSQDWAHGGPLLESTLAKGGLLECRVWDGGELPEPYEFANRDADCRPLNGDWSAPLVMENGLTPLIALCRAIVAEKFGDELPERE